MTKQSLFDQLVNGFANAVGDVREKLVDEGWFGKPTAPTGGELVPPESQFEAQLGAQTPLNSDSLSEEDHAAWAFTLAVLEPFLEPIEGPYPDDGTPGMGETIDPETGMDL